MAASPLDNPIWTSLCARHAAIAIGSDSVRRYPCDYGPFLGVARDGVEADRELAQLVPPDESVNLIGPAPRVGPAWRLTLAERLPQLVCTAPARPVDGPAITSLGPRRYGDALALTQRVYPHYFRRRTPALGRYFGIYSHGQLAAMIGERFGDDGHIELSGICTHPDFTHRGYARRLIAFLTNDVLAGGHTPFLHVSRGNPHALALYEALGYRIRAELPFWTLRRTQERRSAPRLPTRIAPGPMAGGRG